MILRQLISCGSLIVLVGCSQISSSFIPIAEIAAEAQLQELPDHEKYLDEGAVIILDHKVTNFTYTKEGFQRYESFRSILMYASEKGESWLTPTIYLDNGDELESFQARTIQPNGNVIELSVEDLYPTQIKPRFVEFTTNSSVKFTFKGVMPGAILEYFYSVKKGKGFSTFSGWSIDKTLPCLCSKYSLQVPEGILGGVDQNWEFVAKNTALQDPVKSRSKADTHHMLHFDWVRTDLPAIKIEPYMPPMSEVRQYATLGVMPKGWDDFAEWFWELAGISFGSNDNTRELGEMLSGDSFAKYQKVERIFNHTQQNYRYVAVDIDKSGMIPNLPMEIVNRKYGDCKDLTALNVSLLTGLKVQAYPALVSPWKRRELHPDIALPEFSHMVTYVERGGEQGYWLDSTGSFCPLGLIHPALAGTEALVIKPSGECSIKQIPENDLEVNAIDRFVHVDIDEQGRLSGRTRVRFAALHSMMLRSRFKGETLNDLQDALLEQLGINDLRLEVSDLHCGDLSEISDTLIIEFDWSCRNRGSNASHCIVPSGFYTLFEPLPEFDPETRHNPIRLNYPILIRDVMEVDWSGTTFRLSVPPTPMVFEESFGSLGCAMSKSGEQGIKRHTRLYMDNSTIQSDQFKETGRFFDAIALLNEENMVFTSD